MRKYTVLLLVTCLVVSCLIVLTVTPTNAQKPSPPSVPKFSVKLVAHPYDVPPTTTSSFDTSTWTEITITEPGYRVENRSIEVTIKNQHFTPYTLHTSERDYEINLYYAVEVKEHFSEDWHTFRFSIYSYAYQDQSDSGYTVVSGSADYDAGVKLDFRVQAVIGYRQSATADSLAGLWLGPMDSMSFSTSSNWSDIQTITITSGSSSSPSQTTTFPSATSDNNDQPQLPDQTQTPNNVFSNPFFMLGVGAFFVGVVVVVVMVFRSRHLSSVVFEVEGRS